MNTDLCIRALDCISTIPGRMCLATYCMRRVGLTLSDDIIEALILLLDKGSDEALEQRIEEDIRKIRRWLVDSL